jgi:AcrR family transcriptional regulator
MVTSKRRTASLTRDELFETALRLVDQEGLEALTMRRLGDEVGVEAASLYHHVPNKEALIDGVLVRMRSEVRLPTTLPTDWIEIFEVIFAEYRRVLTAHPNLMLYAGRRVESDPETSGLESLTQMGFSQDDAVDLWQSLIAFSVGFSVFSSSAAETDTSDLPPGLALRMAQWNDETFSRTLRMILEGHAADVGLQSAGGLESGGAATS